MEQQTPVYKLIARWPSRADLAADLSAITGRTVSVDRVHKWAAFGAIPAPMQAHVLRAAHIRGFGVSPGEMLEFHAAPIADADRQGSAA